MKYRSLICAVALATAVLAAPAWAMAGDEALGGNAVTRGVVRSLDAVRDQNAGTPNAGRLYGMVTVAMYDAVNGIDRARGNGRAHALVSPSGAPINGHPDVAAAAAAHAVLSRVLRADQSPVSDGALDAALRLELSAAGGETNRRVAAGREWGSQVGDQMVALRSADGTQAAQMIGACSRFSDPALCEPGEFRTSFDARWADMAPFGTADLSPYESPPAPAPSSGEYARAFDDVKTCGSNSPALDALCTDPTAPAERAEISDFWLAEARTVRETGTWLQAGLAIAEQQETVESTSQTARLFALLGMSIADAVKLSWETKEAYFTWRPTTAIREADTDENPDTAKDEGWTSRIGAVGASPEYNSGTSTFAGAASAAIEGFYCRSGIDFSFQTDMASSGPRSYTGPLEAAREAGRSRIFQGIHFQFSNEDGRRAGRGIGSEIVSTKLQPLRAGPKAGSCR